MKAPLESTLAPTGTLQEMEISRFLPTQRAPQARVIHSLKQWMSDGALSAGSLLPSERVLSEQLQVNRGTVRRALQVLQEEGLLRTQNGRTRIVTQQNERRAGALRNSVALIAPLFSSHPTEAHRNGRIEFISRGAMEAIRQIGKHAMALNPDCLTKNEVQELASELPFGVVITDIAVNPARGIELASWFRAAGVPVSIYGDSPANDPFDRVTSDQEDGSYQLTKYLIERDCRRILNFWSAPADRYWNLQRRAGYERAMNEAGLAPLPTAQMPPFPQPDGDAAAFERSTRATAGYLIEHLVGEEPVDGLLLSTDSDYFGVAAACRLCGKEPQRDVLIVGYDNYWFDDDKRRFEATAPLATIDKRNEVMGGELLRLLADRVKGTLPAGPQRRVVRPQICVTDGGAE
jgi:DNA-binding LacI/PurR family transcriptional regulator